MDHGSNDSCKLKKEAEKVNNIQIKTLVVWWLTLPHTCFKVRPVIFFSTLPSCPMFVWLQWLCKWKKSLLSLQFHENSLTRLRWWYSKSIFNGTNKNNISFCANNILQKSTSQKCKYARYFHAKKTYIKCWRNLSLVSISLISYKQFFLTKVIVLFTYFLCWHFRFWTCFRFWISRKALPKM